MSNSNEEVNLFLLLEDGEGFEFILHDTNDVLRWEIADLIHLKVNVTLNECFCFITAKYFSVALFFASF